MLKYFIVPVLCFLALNIISAQDKIKRMNGKVVECKITSVDSAKIVFNFSPHNNISSFLYLEEIACYIYKGNYVEIQKFDENGPMNTVNIKPDQVEHILSNKTEFKDGVYFSYKDFTSNSPSLGFDEIRFDRLEGGKSTVRYLYNFRPSPDINIDLDTVIIWGICMDGYPYINQSNLFNSYTEDTKISQDITEENAHSFTTVRVNEGNFEYQSIPLYKNEKHAYSFSRIRFIGHLCLFTAESRPTNGKPINNIGPEKEENISLH